MQRTLRLDSSPFFKSDVGKLKANSLVESLGSMSLTITGEIMKKIIKEIMSRVMPGLYHAISSYRFSRHCKSRFGQFQEEFARCVFGNKEIRIMSGPFEGMLYFNRIVWGPITPKWIGSYEVELTDIIEEIIRVKYDRIFDVGAAEGYYAVGFARSCPDSEVLAYDVDPIARARQRQLALLNSIGNLVIGKYCSHNTLNRSLNNRSLLFCDIEGFEYELLDPRAVSKLKETDILVEVHKCGLLESFQVKQELLARFADSHKVVVVQAEDRVANEWAARIEELHKLEGGILTKALNEHRSDGREWLWMKAEQGGALNAVNGF